VHKLPTREFSEQIIEIVSRAFYLTTQRMEPMEEELLKFSNNIRLQDEIRRWILGYRWSLQEKVLVIQTLISERFL